MAEKGGLKIQCFARRYLYSIEGVKATLVSSQGQGERE